MKYMTRVRHDEVIIDILTTFKLTITTVTVVTLKVSYPLN